MTRRPRRNHSPAFKAKVALAAISNSRRSSYVMVKALATEDEDFQVSDVS
jgi:hypothetical protein